MNDFVAAIRLTVANLPDASLAAIVGALGFVLLLAGWRVLRPAGAARLERIAADRHAVLEDRIAQLIDERQTWDVRLGERLHAQERALADVLDRKLNASAARIDLTLGQSREAAHATLSGLAERIGRIDAAQARLATLSGQIDGLERALGDKQARGALGEARLSDLLRDALPPDAFVEQATLANGRRADALLLLPHPPGPMAVDSKFPLEGYMALADAPGADAKTAARKKFSRDVAKHIADIADRYIVPGVTADCALMFVPSEAVYAEIHGACREVVEEGFRRRVYIVSPTTLWATLNTARAILKDARVREQSAVLQHEAMGLVADVMRLAGKAESAKRRLELAGTDLDALAVAARAAERRGRRIADMDLDAPGAVAPEQGLPELGLPDLEQADPEQPEPDLLEPDPIAANHTASQHFPRRP